MMIKKDKYIVNSLIIGAVISILLLLLWDCGTQSEIQELTMNPCHVDFSLKNIDVNGLIQTLLSAVVGFTLTIFFVELLLSKSREQEIETKKKIQQDNITKLLRVPLMRYAHAMRDLINSADEIPNSLPTTIDFYALAGMYESSSQLRELLRPKIVVLSESITNLKRSVSSILLNTDLKDNPELLKLLTDFLVMEDACNPCHDLLNYQNLRVGGKPLVESIKKDILEWHLPLEKIGYSNELTPVLKLKGFIEHTNAFVAKIYEVIPEVELSEEKLEEALRTFIQE